MNIMSKTYELHPHNGRKSFYGKAVVQEYENGLKELYSYNTLILSIDKNNDLHRHYDNETVSNTTLIHIKTFLIDEKGESFADKFDKKTYLNMPVEEPLDKGDMEYDR